MTLSVLLQRWDTWWCRQVPPHALAILRIALGIFLLLYTIPHAWHIDMLASRSGLVIPKFLFESSILPQWIIMPPDPLIARIIFSCSILALIGITLGYRMRFFIVVFLLLFLYYWQLTLYLFHTSYGRIFFFTLLVLLLSGADRTYSWRMKQKKGSWRAWEPVSILPTRILTIQVTMTYLIVGLQKSYLPDWQSGEILAHSFVGIWGTPLAFWFARLNFSMQWYDVLNWIVKAWEYTIPIAFWVPRFRVYAFITATLFHTFITLFLAIWWFMAMPAFFPLFLKPEDVHAWCRRHGG